MERKHLSGAFSSLILSSKSYEPTCSGFGFLVFFFKTILQVISGETSSPNSSVYEILQAKILEWVTIPFSRRSSQPTD